MSFETIKGYKEVKDEFELLKNLCSYRENLDSHGIMIPDSLLLYGPERGTPRSSGPGPHEKDLAPPFGDPGDPYGIYAPGGVTAFPESDICPFFQPTPLFRLKKTGSAAFFTKGHLLSL